MNKKNDGQQDDLISIVSDFRDIEDSIIWIMKVLKDYGATKALKISEDLLKETNIYKYENFFCSDKSTSRNG